MRLVQNLFRTTTIAMATLSLSSAAVAQAPPRTFVSTSGNDANPCSRSAPCRNFAAAVNAVVDGGEVVALDSGGYGPVSITKSVTIVAPLGVHAAIAASSGDAITINAPGIDVVLRGLALIGTGATHGVFLDQAASASIEHCTMTGFAGRAIFAHHNMADYDLYVSDSVVRNSGGGIYAFAGGFKGRLMVQGCQLLGVGKGVENTGGVHSSITNTVISGFTGDGVYGYAGETNIESCQIVNGATGIRAGGFGGTVRISNSVIANNATGIDFDSGGTVYSRQNNSLVNNPVQWVDGTPLTFAAW